VEDENNNDSVNYEEPPASKPPAGISLDQEVPANIEAADHSSDQE
jgi:hypothetical protein